MQTSKTRRSMRPSNANLITLNAVFVVCLIVANVVTSKVLDTGIFIGGVPVLIPGAALTYAMTFLCTDVIGEIWGKEEANKAVIRGFAAQLVALALIVLTMYLPAYDEEMQRRIRCCSVRHRYSSADRSSPTSVRRAGMCGFSIKSEIGSAVIRAVGGYGITPRR